MLILPFERKIKTILAKMKFDETPFVEITKQLQYRQFSV